MKLIATRSLKKYGTRRMQAGDEFDATPRHAKWLFAVRKAKDARREAGTLPPPPPAVARMLGSEHSEQPHPERDALRENAEALGVDVDGRWGADRLREEIEKAVAQNAAADDAAYAAAEEVNHDG